MSTTVNPTLSTSEQIFKNLVWNPALKLATANYPFLAIWPISSMINLISNYIFSGFVKQVDVTGIQLINSAHQSVYEKASVTLAVIAHDKGIDSKEFQDANANALIALSAFTRVNI